MNIDKFLNILTIVTIAILISNDYICGTDDNINYWNVH